MRVDLARSDAGRSGHPQGVSKLLHALEYRPRDGFVDRLFLAAKRGYLANRFGYAADVPFAERLVGLLPWIYPGRPAELDFSVMWLEPCTRGRLLDVGAGSGWLVAQMCTLGWQAEGVDFDDHAVATARARGLSVRQGSLPEQMFPENSHAITMIIDRTRARSGRVATRVR
jgi:2-polyprenyl-3-methyl-5-hydroxy-6-metoxy-1,4-benzoquinol methylase